MNTIIADLEIIRDKIQSLRKPLGNITHLDITIDAELWLAEKKIENVISLLSRGFPPFQNL